MTPATSVPSIPRGFGPARPAIGSPLHQSTSWDSPHVPQQMQQHGGKDHNKQPKRTVDPEAPLSERKDTRPKIIYGEGDNSSPTGDRRPSLHDAGLD
jgi:hypothetical protein